MVVPVDAKAHDAPAWPEAKQWANMADPAVPLAGPLGDWKGSKKVLLF